jgi:hypothetical protein
MPSPLQLQRVIYPAGAGGAAFVGAMDGYASSISRLWCPGKRLLSSWAGNAATLRETTGSTEETFGYGADGYLNTTAIASFLSAAGASAAAHKVIFDQKGSGDDLTQTTAASQPLYVSSHSGFNNRACIHLDSVKGMPSTLDIARPYSIVVIEDDDGTLSSLRTITAYTGTSTFENNLICANRSGLSAFRNGVVSSTSTAAACVEVFTGPSSGNHAFYCNGTNITTTGTASGDWRKLAVGRAPGGTEGAITKLFAIIVFNTALSAGDVTALQAILAPASL